MPFRKNIFFNTTRITFLMAAGAVAISLVVLMGWLFQSPIFTSFNNEWVSMKVNTALGALSATGSLLFYTKGRKKISALLGLFTLLLGAITIAEYAFGWNARIDEILFEEHATGRHPGRMSQIIAISFILSGISLLCLQNKKYRILTDVLSILVLAAGFLSFTGYLYNARHLYSVANFNSVSFPGALILICVSSATLFSQPEQGLMSAFNEKTKAAKLGILQIFFLISLLQVLGWLCMKGYEAGYYDMQFGLGVMLVIFIVIFLLTLVTGIGELNRSEAESNQLYKMKEKSERDLRQIMDNSSGLIASVDREHRTIAFNKAFENEYKLFSGIDLKPGVIYYNVLEPEEQKIWIAKINEALAGTSVKFERTYEISGQKKYFEISLYPIRNDSVTEGVTCFVTDITERIKVEKALKKSESRLRKAQTIAHIGSWYVDFKKQEVEWSEETYHIYGVSPESFTPTAESIIQLVHPDDRKAMQEHISSYFEGNNLGELEVRVVRPDGTLRYVVSRGSLKLDKEGQTVSITGTVQDITSMKKAELLIREKENRLRTIFNTEPECIKLLNEKGELLDMNPAGLVMLEADDLEMIKGKQVLGIVAQPYRLAFGELTKKVFAGGSGMLQFEITGLKGTHRWLETHAVPMRDAEGNISSLLSVTRDITERKRAEEDLKKSEAKLREITASLPGIVYQYITDAAGKLTFTFLSDGIKQYQDDKAEDIYKDSSLLFAKVHPDDIRKLVSAIEASNKKMKPLTIAYRIFTKEGKYIWMRSDSIPVKLQDGTVMRNGSLIDISATKEAEEKLQLSEMKLKNLVENIHESLIIEDREGKLQYANGEFSKIFGYTEEEFKNLSLRDYTAPQSLKEVMERHNKRMQGLPVPDTFEYKALRKDGKEIWIDCRVTVLKENGKIIGTQSLERDITDRKLAEEKLKESEEKYRSLMQQAGDAIVLFDGTGKILDANESALQLLCYNDKEYHGISLQDVVFEEDLKTNPFRFDLLNKGIPTITRRRLKRKDGSAIEAELHVKKLSDGRYLGAARDLTERIKAEQQIRESEQKYRSIVERNLAGIYQTTPAGKIITCNTAFARMMGYTSQFLMQQDAGILYFSTGDRNEFIHILKKTGEVINREIKLKHKDGSPVFLIESCFLQTNPLTGEQLIEGVVIDITKRKQAEESLKLSEEKYRSLIEQASDFILITDSLGIIVDVNSSSCNAFGYTRQELIGRNIACLTDPEDLKNQPFQFDHLKKGHSVLRERKMLDKKGNLIDVEVSVKMITDGRLLAIARDIRDRKKAEQQIREQETRFRLLVDTAPDATIIADERGIIQIANLQAVKLFGYSKTELTGMSVELLIPAKDRDKHKDYRSQFVNVSKTRLMGSGRDLVAVNKAGVEIPVEISLSPFHSSEGVLVTASIRDITLRKKAEKELAESYRAVRQLTKHLQNVREEERTHIAREIHDELGQQLTVMMMDVSWLGRKIDPENRLAAKKLNELLVLMENMVITVRRISTELRPSVLDDLGLGAAIEMHLKEFKKRTGISTRLIVPKEEPEMKPGVKNGMFRIVQESLTNVARHALASEVLINLEKRGNKLYLLINDNGIGFDEKEAAAKKTLGVLGMKERAAAFGGEYFISGTPGKGTSIQVNVSLN